MQSFIPDGHRLVKVNHKTWIQLKHGQEAKEIKTDKDYVPENNNKRGSGKIVMYKGKVYQSISILAEHLGIKRWNLSKQIKAGKITVKILK